jgi:hypothetical protein
MSKHDVRFVPRPWTLYSASTNGPTYTATASNNLTVQWYEAVFCDCARCRAIDAVRGAWRWMFRR